ncbi:hypothetical protein EDD86DRAFT_210199 [Gorgonomyces haynaldii]|nr:hypothetical protein EDD86DRAFT_210199 [Gorgonomyces haynaldii]
MVTRSKSKDYNPTPFYIAFFVLIGLCIGGMFIKKGQEKQVTARVHALNQEYKHRYIVLEEEAVLSHSKTFNGHTTKYYDRFVHIYCTVAIAQVAPVYPPQPVSPVYSPHPVGQGYVQPVAQGYTQQMGQYPPVSQRYAEYPNQGYAQPVQQPVADLEKGNRQ